MDRTVTLNGVKYVKQGAEFDEQTQKAMDCLGPEMGLALAKNNAIIAGGAILSQFTHQEVNDVDVYFRSMEDLARAFVDVTKDWESVYLGHTDKSITLKDRETEAMVQFIYFDFFDSAEAVFEAFDFTVCMVAIELHEEKSELVMHPKFLSDVASRTLHFNNGTRYPYISLIRTKKYQERGYKIGRGNVLAIALACATRPINSWDDAKEQLGGVYGNAIELRVNDGEEFSQDKLHDVVTQISDKNDYVNTSNFEKLYLELTGHEFGSLPEDF